MCAQEIFNTNCWVPFEDVWIKISLFRLLRLNHNVSLYCSIWDLDPIWNRDFWIYYIKALSKSTLVPAPCTNFKLINNIDFVNFIWKWSIQWMISKKKTFIIHFNHYASPFFNSKCFPGKRPHLITNIVCSDSVFPLLDMLQF